MPFTKFGLSSQMLEGVRAMGYIEPTQDFHTYESDTTRNMVCWPTRIPSTNMSKVRCCHSSWL